MRIYDTHMIKRKTYVDIKMKVLEGNIHFKGSKLKFGDIPFVY